MNEFDTYIKYMKIFFNKYNRFPSKFSAELKILNHIVKQANEKYSVEELDTIDFNNITFIIDESKKNIGEFK